MGQRFYGLANAQPSRTKLRQVVLGIAALTMGMQAAHSFVIESGDPDTTIRWDNTTKYNAAWRLKNPDQFVANGNGAQPNTDFGDMGHSKGLINNRFDLLSELDVTHKNVGFRVSAAAWNDSHYTGGNNAYSGALPNNQAALTGANNQMSREARNIMGRHAEFSDAFIFGKADLEGGQSVDARLGRHTVLYGESLFLGANGIAAAQGPVDLIKAYSLPNAQFKEIGLPVGQLSGNYQVSPGVSFGAYYQYEWRPLRLPAAGSYFGAADFVGQGGDLLLTPAGLATRVADQKGKAGNVGGRMKFRNDDTEYGLFVAKYDDAAPTPVVNLANLTYSQVYARNVKMLGASFSTVVGETNVAGEISTRRGTALHPVGDLVLALTDDGQSSLAKGNTLHANLSAISVFPANKLWNGASFVGELAFNRLLSVTNNPSPVVDALNTTHTRDAYFTRFVFQPEYFQVMPGVDLQVPIGVGYGLKGRSSVLQLSPEHGGDMNIGLNFDVKKQYKAGIQYTRFFGPAGPAPSLDAATNSYASYKQYYRDRDFVSVSLQMAF
jgi:hypothetical protein